VVRLWRVAAARLPTLPAESRPVSAVLLVDEDEFRYSTGSRVIFLGVLAAMHTREVNGNVEVVDTALIASFNEPIDLGIVYKARCVDECVQILLDKAGLKRKSDTELVIDSSAPHRGRPGGFRCRVDSHAADVDGYVSRRRHSLLSMSEQGLGGRDTQVSRSHRMWFMGTAEGAVKPVDQCRGLEDVLEQIRLRHLCGCRADPFANCRPSCLGMVSHCLCME
jgi:hypothetical protein